MRHRGSKREAERLRTKFLGQVDTNKSGRTRASLGALLDEWLPGAEPGPNIRDNYGGLIERFIRPAVGAPPLSKVTPQRIERFYGELRRCRARCDERPFIEHRRPGKHNCVRKPIGPGASGSEHRRLRRLPAEVGEVFARDREHRRAQGTPPDVVVVRDVMEDFTLSDATGTDVTLSQLVAGDPAILVLLPAEAGALSAPWR